MTSQLHEHPTLSAFAMCHAHRYTIRLKTERPSPDGFCPQWLLFDSANSSDNCVSFPLYPLVSGLRLFSRCQQCRRAPAQWPIHSVQPGIASQMLGRVGSTSCAHGVSLQLKCRYYLQTVHPMIGSLVKQNAERGTRLWTLYAVHNRGFADTKLHFWSAAVL